MGDIIGGAMGLIGSIQTANASKRAASTISNAIGKGIDFQQGVFNTTQQNLQPWIGSGQSALSALQSFYGLGGTPGAQAGFNQFTQTPYYQFPLQQGTLALNRQLAASGLTGSGAALKEGAQYASGLASQALTGYLGGLGGLATSGQNAAATLGQQGNVAAGTMLQGYTNQGGAQGAGIIGSNNALQQGYQSLLGPLGSFANGLIGAPSSSTSYTGAGSLGTSLGNWLGITGASNPPNNSTNITNNAIGNLGQIGTGLGLASLFL
jgi:hypothetical protein